MSGERRDDEPEGSRPTGSGPTGSGEAVPEGDEGDVFSRLLEGDLAIDELFGRLLQGGEGGGRPIQVVLPKGALSDGGGIDLAEFLESVMAEYADIDEALAALHADDEVEPARVLDESELEFLTEAEIVDQGDLTRALADLDSDTARFEYLFAQAHHALERLDRFQVSGATSAEVMLFLKTHDNVGTVQYLVEFLAALRSAADSFDEIDLPRSHIRGYLEYLYSMNDWREMRRLVRRLELAVRKYLRVRDPRRDAGPVEGGGPEGEGAVE